MTRKNLNMRLNYDGKGLVWSINPNGTNKKSFLGRIFHRQKQTKSKLKKKAYFWPYPKIEII